MKQTKLRLDRRNFLQVDAVTATGEPARRYRRALSLPSGWGKARTERLSAKRLRYVTDPLRRPG